LFGTTGARRIEVWRFGSIAHQPLLARRYIVLVFEPSFAPSISSLIIQSDPRSLAGGSVPAFLSSANLSSAFSSLSIPPNFDKWHVLLADERVVKSDDPDSNILALRSAGFLSSVEIASECHVYGLDDEDITAELSDSELASIASK
jgi:hypothetical protein